MTPNYIDKMKHLNSPLNITQKSLKTMDFDVPKNLEYYPSLLYLSLSQWKKIIISFLIWRSPKHQHPTISEAYHLPAYWITEKVKWCVFIITLLWLNVISTPKEITSTPNSSSYPNTKKILNSSSEFLFIISIRITNCSFTFHTV